MQKRGRQHKISQKAKNVRASKPATEHSPTKEKAEPVSQSFRKFSPQGFEKWKDLSREEMIHQIIVRHGVKLYRQKPEKEKIKWPVPIRVEAHGRPGYKGSYRFWLKIPGKRAYSLHLPVDVSITAHKRVESVPNWRDSKDYLKISDAIGSFTSSFMLDLLHKRSGESHSIANWFAEALSKAGFNGPKFVHHLEKEVTEGRFLSMCQTYFLYTDRIARAYLKGFTFDEVQKLSEEQWQMIEAGMMAKVVRIPSGAPIPRPQD